MPHALLIHGPQGVGKLALAEHLTQALLCENGEETPCGHCPGCRWFIAGSHPDYRLIEPEALARASEPVDEEGDAPAPQARAAKPSAEIKVDQVRGLDDFLNLKSHRDGYRIALVHPAEAMNVNAANALLKSLEEPPGAAMFVLVSHRPSWLLATIRSRCVPYAVPIPNPDAAGGWLRGQGVSDPARWLAFASGAPLRALELARDPEGEEKMRLWKALESRDLDQLARVQDREQLEVLAEVLQKFALDRAFISMSGRGKYGPAKSSTHAAAWLKFARKMGRNRRLAGHPLNPRLFAGEMLREMPTD
ncbi:MAG: DNA polymerase III subunit delta' [Burkholderiales bacterium]